MSKGELVKPVSYGLHGTQRVFYPGDWIIPSEEHKAFVTYPGFSDKRYTYFTPIPHGRMDYRLMKHILNESCRWSDGHVYLTIPFGPQFIDANLSMSGIARVCPAQKVVQEIRSVDDIDWSKYSVVHNRYKARLKRMRIVDKAEAQVPSVYWG